MFDTTAVNLTQYNELFIQWIPRKFMHCRKFVTYANFSCVFMTFVFSHILCIEYGSGSGR